MLKIIELLSDTYASASVVRGCCLWWIHLYVRRWDTAAQPMVDSALGLAIVFNGCIYNYPELRKELIGMGYSFFSHGDTEVILKAYHAWGKDCVKHFHGMFAFAIWERDSKRVFMARDRLGIKPFYYYKTDKFMRFASTLPALLKSGGIDAD